MAPVKFPPPPPPPQIPEKEKPPPAMSRKLTSPFTWLSRNSSSKKPESPPLSLSDRRNTNASIQSLSSNPELTLSRIQDEGEQPKTNRTSQGNLRDRFKLLRMREEAGIVMSDETTAGAEPALGVASPPAEKEQFPGATSPPTGGLTRQPTVNPALAPGTAAGFAAGPSGDASEPVDWDLWQSVVNEGPAVISRTSPEELSRATANGIPQVIRGVIWQVLAQSKNEDLERQYRELVARGTDKEHLSLNAQNLGPAQPNGNGKERDSIASSASSVHSDYSTPATTTGSTNAPLPSPSVQSDGAEDSAKNQARLAAEKKQNTAAIVKLEKAIKRDLGARTSYSKYLMAAGLQDGLFGICKAYALYDEAVGYAQGMNFIAMPLLFNVSF
jgi:hypothetical protein